ncbi:hypothetical protein OAN96_00330 [Candidatus Gracilibacteria bacterium]|nr:hypothetical protein [Candidatus Gracilibacteria bacterium]
MKKKSAAEYILYSLFTVGMIIITSLVIGESWFGQVCPIVAGIPACYFILPGLIVLIAMHMYKVKNLYFYTLSILYMLMALYAAIFQTIGTFQCPKFNGFPMCYASLTIFVGIIICKYLTSRK